MKKNIFALAFVSTVLAASIFAQQKGDALAMYRAKRYDEGIAICKQELQANPRNVESYVVLCWNLNGAKRFQEAETYALEARKIDPKNTRLMEALAESRYYQGKNAPALEMFQLYVSNAPTDAGDYGWAYYYMGEIFIRQGRYEHADMSYSMATRIDPVKALWWSRCGYAREMAGSYASALEAYNKAVALDSRQTDAARGRERVASKVR